jgi:hypothetical protein
VDVRTPSKGSPITNRYIGSATGQKLGIHPGQHVFTASVEGMPDQVWRIDIANGGTYQHTFEFDKGKPVMAEGFKEEDLATEPKTPPKMERPVPVSVYALAGVTGALAIGTGVTMGLAAAKKSDYDAINGTRPAAELDEARSGVVTMNLVADILLGATAVSLVTTGILLLTRPSKPVVDEKKSAFQLVPAVSPNSASAVVIGQF